MSDHVGLAIAVARQMVGRAGGTPLLMGGTGGRRIRRDVGLISAAGAALPPLAATLALRLAPIRVNLISTDWKAAFHAF